MILVMLGTQNNSFKRLLKELDRLKEKKIIKEKIIVQAGYTKYNSKNLEVFDFIEKDKLEKAYKEIDKFKPKKYIPNNSKIIKLVEDFIEIC